MLVDADLFDLRRPECLADELGGIVAERDDVDLLATEFVHDHTDARAPGTDAGTCRIDVGIVRPDRHLGPMARLARHGLDLDDAVGDLRNLELK